MTDQKADYETNESDYVFIRCSSCNQPVDSAEMCVLQRGQVSMAICPSCSVQPA